MLKTTFAWNNILTIRGERKFEKQVNDGNYLRVERAYGSFARSFSLANSVNTEAIKTDYQNGVLTLHIPKCESAKPKQIKVNLGTQGNRHSSRCRELSNRVRPAYIGLEREGWLGCQPFCFLLKLIEPDS